jgi:predicted phosphodiesterase
MRLDTDGLFFTYMTDIHLSALPPGRRVGNYRKSILNKIRFIQEWNNRLGGVCLCGGDFFHIKKPLSRANPKGLINDAIDILSGFNTGKILGVVGNHDVEYDRMDTLDNQPLGVLAHAGVYEILSEPTLFEDKNGLTVEVVPFHSDEDIQVLQNILEMDKALRKTKRPDYRIGIAHAMARPGGAQAMHGQPIIGYNLLEDIDFDAFLWGHDHSRVEPTEVGICTHFHPGSLSRAALSHDEVEQPIMALGLQFSSEGWGFKEREIPVEALEVAFRTGDKAVQKADESTDYKAFIQDVTSSIGELEVSDPIEIIRSLCAEDPKLESLVMEVCEF